MKLSYSRSAVHCLILISLFAALIGGAVWVTPVWAATFIVDSTTDAVDAAPGNSVCATAGGVCTLRAAIQEANALPGDDIISVPADTYTLTIAGINEDAAATGDLDITSNIAIHGAGAGSTIIQAGTLGAGGPPNGIDRVFHVTGAFTVNISDVTAGNGNTAGNGGGIYNLGTLTLTNSAFSGNSANLTSGGGGIYNTGTLILTNSTFSGNFADMLGGGIFNEGGTMDIMNSTFSGNTVNQQGGGIFTYNGMLTVTNSTFALNTSMDGGGIFNFGGTASIANSTFSGNSATAGPGSVGNGGGILGFGNAGNLTITNSTFSGNTASGYGGGLRISAGTASLGNTILANSPSGGNCSGIPIANAGNNIDSGTTCGWGSTNSSMSDTDPLLGVLTGSPAFFPLSSGSPAIDAGNNAICAAVPVSNTSQNGLARPQGPFCDIGSYESADTIAPTVVSITRADANPTGAASIVHFTVSFSEAVTGVDAADFNMTITGTISTPSVTGVTGGPTAYTVTVNTGTGSGTLRLNVPVSAAIADLAGNPLMGLPYTSGETYDVGFYRTYLPRVLK